MKIGLIVPANIKYSPYVHYYIELLNKNNVEYKIMMWDKAGVDEVDDMIFHFETSDFNRKKILLGHALFSIKCKEYIKKERIDHLIIFTIAPLFFLGYRYLRKFQGKLMLDIRDDSPFRRHFPDKLKKFGELAHTLVVSSPYYSEWFNKSSILCHNADFSIIKRYSGKYGKDQISSPIRIVYAGMMIEEDINIAIIEQLKNDKDFQFTFIGRDNEKKEKIKEYVSKDAIQNVGFKGEYRKEDIVDIYRQEADLVNILRQDTIINRNALPNKLYDAVVSGIPLVVFRHNTAIADYVGRYNLGIIVDGVEDIKRQLINGLQKFDSENYKSGRTEFLNLIQNDYYLFAERLKNFCQKK